MAREGTFSPRTWPRLPAVWVVIPCANGNNSWLLNSLPKQLPHTPWCCLHIALVADILRLLLNISNNNTLHFTLFLLSKMSSILSQRRCSEKSPQDKRHTHSQGGVKVSVNYCGQEKRKWLFIYTNVVMCAFWKHFNLRSKQHKRRRVGGWDELGGFYIYIYI